MESYADYDSSGDWRSSSDFKFPVAARRHYQASSSCEQSAGSVSVTRMDEVKTGRHDDSEYDMDEIKYEDIIFGDKIGEGAFGEVFRGSVYGQEVALKKLRMNPASPEESAARLREFVEEIKIMKTLRHPNIVAFLGACYREPKLCIVTEFLEGGNLEDYMARQREAGRIPPLSGKRAIKIAKDIARGLNWLHHKGVIHRDLKSANILLDRNNNVKIADFGLAHIKNRMSSQKTGFYGIVGTPCYMAPEVLKDSPYGVKADVFSFSIVLCELVAGEYPYKDGSAPEATNDFERAIITGLRPVIPAHCHPDIARLIIDCWAEDPDLRPDMDEVMRRLDEIQRNAFPVSSSDALEEAPAAVVQIVEDSKKRIEELENKLRNAQIALHSERSLRQRLESSIGKEPSQGNRRSPSSSVTAPLHHIPTLPKAPPPRGPPPPNTQPVRTLLTTRAVAQLYLPSNEAATKPPQPQPLPLPQATKKLHALEAEVKVTTATTAAHAPKAVPPTVPIQDLYRHSPSPSQLPQPHPAHGRAPLPRTSPELDDRNHSPTLRPLPQHPPHQPLHRIEPINDDEEDYDDDEDFKGFHDSSDEEDEDGYVTSRSSAIPPQARTGTVIYTPQDGTIRPRPPTEDPPLKPLQPLQPLQPQGRPLPHPAAQPPSNQLAAKTANQPQQKPPQPVQTKKLSIFGKLLGRKEKAPEPAIPPQAAATLAATPAPAVRATVPVELSEDAESYSMDQFLNSTS